MSDDIIDERLQDNITRERGQGLRAIRKAFDLSIGDIAKAMGVSTSQVSAMERGRNNKHDIQAYAWACVNLWHKGEG